jgi:wobble nucleotide-excising tRNase
VLRTLAGKAQQLVVFSHDPLFIQSFCEDDSIRRLGVTVLELRRGPNDYTVLDACDIEERVETEYKMNCRTLVAYVTEGEVVDRQKVVRAIRPMLEANLRHRFQDSLKGAYSLGKMIEAIRTCKPGDPLEVMKPKEEDLDDINDFATDFTHDSEADGSLWELDDAQLKNYAKRALAIARGN